MSGHVTATSAGVTPPDAAPASVLDGRYTFETVRPGSYPNSRNPQHIHMHVIEPGRCTYWIDDVLFTDDPLLNDAERNRREPRGGLGVATP